MQFKKLFEITLFVICLGFLLPLFSEDLSNHIYAADETPNVLLFIRHAARGQGTPPTNERMITEEVNVMIGMLEDAGFDVVIASASGEPLEGETTRLIPDMTLADVRMEEYAGIMLPCFALGSLGWHASPEEIDLVKDAVASGKPIAAQHGAVVMLVEAGVLAGKKYAYTMNFAYYKKFTDAIWSGERLMQDGNIITSSHCPYAAPNEHKTSELTELFIAAMQQ